VSLNNPRIGQCAHGGKIILMTDFWVIVQQYYCSVYASCMQYEVSPYNTE